MKVQKNQPLFLIDFPNRYYLEIQNHGIPEEEANLKNMKKLSQDLNLPLVCTNDAHYARKALECT